MDKANINKEFTKYLELQNEVAEHMGQIRMHMLRIDKRLTAMTNILDKYGNPETEGDSEEEMIIKFLENDASSE